MGAHENISLGRFPKQGRFLNQRVKVYFHYDTHHYLFGTIVRDDVEAPFATFIRLDDGRVIQATECQYSLIYEKKLEKK